MGRDFQFVQAAWPLTGPGFSALLSPAVKKVVCKSELRQPFLACLAFSTNQNSFCISKEVRRTICAWNSLLSMENKRRDIS